MPLSASRKITLISILAALCLAIQLTPRPPNVEFTSLFTFVTGAMYGSIVGVSFGSFVMFVNGFFSPWGFAGLNMPFQILGMSIIGLGGGLYRKYLTDQSPARFCVEVAIFGVFFTALYDLITNVGVAVSFVLIGMHPTAALFSAMAYGAPFSFVHVCSNTLVFGAISLPLISALSNLSGGEKIWLKKGPLRSQH